MNMAVNLYHDLLYKNKQDYLSQWEFLAKWKIEQLDIRKFKIGYCSPNSPFVKYYAESLEKYPILKKECLSLGLVCQSQEGIKDALIDTFLFPCFDEQGNLFNIAIYELKKGWRLFFPEEPLAVFGLKQATYSFSDCGLAFLLPDIKDFFEFQNLIFPTGINPCIVCLKGINNLILDKLELLEVKQIIAIAQEIPPLETDLETIVLPDKGSVLANLKAALPYLANQRFRRLIEVGLEIKNIG